MLRSARKSDKSVFDFHSRGEGEKKKKRREERKKNK